MRSPEDQEPIGRERILQTALQYVMNDRELEYGGPEDSFSTIARFWNAYTESRPNSNASLDAYDVSVMMVLFKVARMVKRPSKIDSCIDAAGYSACAGEILDTLNRIEAAPSLDSMFTREKIDPPPDDLPLPAAPPAPPTVPRAAAMEAPPSDQPMLANLDWDPEERS